MAEATETTDNEMGIEYVFTDDSAIDIDNMRFQSNADSSEANRPPDSDITYNMRVRTEPPEKPKSFGKMPYCAVVSGKLLTQIVNPNGSVLTHFINPFTPRESKIFGKSGFKIFKALSRTL